VPSDKDLQNMRVNYRRAILDEASAPPAPGEFFRQWLGEAIQVACDEPNAFVLSTVRDGRPRSRVVLLKGGGEDLVFYTNYDSDKGLELGQRPWACATFLWLPLERQVRVEGEITRATVEMSDAYFASRPHGSKIGAWASPQSRVVDSRAVLENAFAEANEKFPEGQAVPRPPHWGGFVLRPQSWEFWQGRENRLHDRLRYRREGDMWVKERLAP